MLSTSTNPTATQVHVVIRYSFRNEYER